MSLLLTESHDVLLRRERSTLVRSPQTIKNTIAKNTCTGNKLRASLRIPLTSLGNHLREHVTAPAKKAVTFQLLPSCARQRSIISLSRLEVSIGFCRMRT